MARKKKENHYGEYCEFRGNDLYARACIRNQDGTYQLKRKKVASKSEARQWVLGELEKARAAPAATLITINDLSEWYKKYYLIAPVYENGHKIAGIKDWKKQVDKLDRITQYFNLKPLEEFTEHDLQVYASVRRKKDKVTAATINRDFSLLRSVFRKGSTITKHIPALKFPVNSSAEVERDRIMSREEEQKILSHCVDVETLEYKRKGQLVKTEKHHAKRSHLRPVIILAVDTGLRCNELRTLTWEDIDMSARVINVKSHNTKTQKARKVGITDRVYDELLKLGPNSGRLFTWTTVRKSFNTARARAGIKDLRFHDLRHTATTRMIRAGIPHTEVMKITGHTQIKTFLRYLNLLDDAVQSAAEKLQEFNGKGF